MGNFQIVLSGQSVHSLTKINSDFAGNNNDNNVVGKTLPLVCKCIILNTISRILKP